MLENIWFIAAVWMGLALIGSLISIRTGISVALVEILVGVIAGNLAVGLEGGTLHISIAGASTSTGGLHHVLQSTEWTNFLALLGSGVLTFLAGAEIDPISLKANWRASVLIGLLSFAIPFGVVWLFAQFVFGWPLHQAQIAGIALSTTSVAVVYAVMIEGGFSDTAMGKMILAACFITDFGTVLALGTLFANYNLWLLLFVIVTLIVLWFMPRWTQAIITRLGATQVSEPEVKFIFFVLFLLGGLATAAKSEAVLPAYLLGLVVAGVFLRDKTLVRRMRSIAFAIFTPFYFIKAGLYVSLPALWTSLLVISDRKETRHLRAGSIHAQDMSKLLCTTAPPATLLVRFSVGAVFLSEGMQKFLFADAQGAGRFAKIGIPAPDIMGPFVGCVEIVCGALLLIGLLTRLAAIPLMIDISVAIISTKVPILLGHGFWRFSLPKLANYGFWSMAHEARADFCMLLGSLFLLVVGAGKKWSLDARLTREHAEGIG